MTSTPSPSHKTWVSPITAVSFLAVTITGFLMLFHVRLPGVRGIHEWMGITMGVGGLLHLILNWRAFVSHFRRRRAVLALLAAVSLVVAALLAPGGDDHRGRERHGRSLPPAEQGARPSH